MTLRLLPKQHRASTVVATFATVEAATDAVLGVACQMRPSMLEFMDAVAINAVEDKLKMGLDRDAAALLLAGSDERGRSAAEDAETDRGRVRASTARPRCSRPTTPTRARPSSPRAASRFPRWRPRARCCSRTSACRCPRLGDLVSGVEHIAAERDVMISVIAHAGDGNTHPLIVFDPADAAMAERAEPAFGEIMDLAVGLGGTITGEHGVGRLKRPWLAGQIGPEAMELNRRIKQALDPEGILNPGAAI